MSQELRINAVAFQEGDAWVIQGIEYDIVAHARDLKSLPHAFVRAVIENICITQHLGRRPLQGIKAAPERYRELFDKAEVEVRPIRPLGGPSVSVRLVEMAA